MNIVDTQSSQLLPTLFSGFEEEQRVHIFHIGPALGDTMEFLSGFRCRVQIYDLFAELPVPPIEETEHGLQAHFEALLQLPEDAAFDICLFWDLFNYLDADALPAFIAALAPAMKPGCRGHGFTVHNPRTPPVDHLYGIANDSAVSIRQRPAPLPGYAPHSQHQLKDLLVGMQMERSVLLSDRRLEFMLRRKA